MMEKCLPGKIRNKLLSFFHEIDLTKKSGHSIAVYSTFKHQFDHYLRPKHKTPNSIFNIWAVDTLWYIEATGLVETQ